jgi:hypothetical protein
MTTKVIQNPGFDSCRIARLYRMARTATTGITAISHQIHGNRVLTTSSIRQPAECRLPAMEVNS